MSKEKLAHLYQPILTDMALFHFATKGISNEITLSRNKILLSGNINAINV